ncbi:hypothetical protein FDP41_004131 [Naegleria fowleri]|uniref:Uncharacterized protein n=1 Tax=Naegleria fowleri TaxID=5763 RepID=A0A6A5BPA8_NAEFO|nr:uncharacterized protein FDP41_004131 [Naegleria fowleri]KAF0976836.1 hypothetical protein FDP41_004131 [Naegleria fowleri]CAG4710146.1 unnamed protein product [Naegleria fowleri]
MTESSHHQQASAQAKKEQEHRRRSALKALAQFKPQVLANKFEFEGKTYSLFSPNDLITKEDPYQCSYCALHAPHTPCGTQLGKYKECLSEQKGQTPSEALSTPSSYENDPCKPVFEKEFYPCFVQLSGSPYLYLRANALFGLETRDLFKVWFDIQKHQALQRTSLH